MKKPRIKKTSLALLAIAVSCAISEGVYAASGSTENSQNTKTAVEMNSKKGLAVKTRVHRKQTSFNSLIVSDFAYRTADIMNSKASTYYVTKTAAADVSTFPMRLFLKMDTNIQMPGPSHPFSYTLKDLTCYYDVPGYTTPLQYDVNKTPINITSDNVTGDLTNKEGKLTYTGDVYITQGDQKIVSDVAVYDGTSRTITTQGSSVFRSPEYSAKSEDVVTHRIDDKLIEITNSVFKFNGSVLRGTAEQHTIDNVKNEQVFKSTTITSCPTQDNTWEMSSTTVTIDKNEDLASGWNNIVWLGPVPVFYIPYAYFPLGKDRRTGLLAPNASYSNDGVSYYQPIYLNLAPNYDMTLTPAYDPKHKRYLGTEFRYMPFRNMSGTIKFNYHPNDPSWTPENGDHKRWYLSVNQNISFLNGDLNFGVNYAAVRKDDYGYVNDISEEDAGINDTSLMQSFRLSYNKELYAVSAEVREYQSLINPKSVAYRPFAMRPQVKASTFATWGPVSFNISGEFTRFNQDNLSDFRSVNMQRHHIQPEFSYHAFDAYGVQLDFGLKGFLTHYSQSQLKSLPSSYQGYLGYRTLEDSKVRALYLFDVDLKAKLERKVWDMNHTQTLEPEIKYQYIPYRDQTGIALYDTTDRFEDYYTLFNHMKFAGIDRISNMNRLTAGFTSRILDIHDREVVRFGLAQAIRFTPERVGLYSTDSYSTERKSNLNGILDTEIISGLTTHFASSYSYETKKFDNYNASVKYRTRSGFLIGTSYRYMRNGNIFVNKETGAVDYGRRNDLRQIGGEIAIPINADWKFVAASYRDTAQKYNIDTKAGIFYEDCCWSVGFMYEKYIQMNKSSQSQKKIVGISFELKEFYELKVRGINNPRSTHTHFIPSIDPTSLNR